MCKLSDEEIEKIRLEVSEIPSDRYFREIVKNARKCEELEMFLNHPLFKPFLDKNREGWEKELSKTRARLDKLEQVLSRYF